MEEHNITNIDVEIRESIVIRPAGPKLLTPTYYSDPTVDLRNPLTTTLGHPICAQSTPNLVGTGGFFVIEGKNIKRLLIITARHVLFQPNRGEGEFISNPNTRHNVMFLSDDAFKDYLESIQAVINGKTALIQLLEKRIKAIEGKDDPKVGGKRNNSLALPRESPSGPCDSFPPIGISVGSEGYTEDWAAIEIDPSRIDTANFIGNAIDLGTDI